MYDAPYINLIQTVAHQTVWIETDVVQLFSARLLPSHVHLAKVENYWTAAPALFSTVAGCNSSRISEPSSKLQWTQQQKTAPQNLRQQKNSLQEKKSSSSREQKKPGAPRDEADRL